MQLFDKVQKVFQTKKKLEPAAIVVGPTKRAVGEFPEITFLTLYNYYLTDPTIQNAVNTFRDQIVGESFYVTGKDQNAIGIIEDFIDGINFDSLLYDIVGDMLVTGNCFVEMITPDNIQDLEILQIITVRKLMRDEFGNPLKIIQLIEGLQYELDPRNFIHFKLFDVARRPFAIGLFHSLAVPQIIDGELRPSVIDASVRMRDSMIRIIDNYASPKDMYTFENASEQFLQDQAVKIRNMKKGESFITNKKFDHKELTIDPRSRFDSYINFIKMQVELGIQSGIIKLQTAHDFTYASAEATKELLDMRVSGIQRRLKHTIQNEIFNRLLIQSNIDPQTAGIELHWGKPTEPEFSVQDVLKAVELSVTAEQNGLPPLLSMKEARKILQKSGWELQEEEAEMAEVELSEQEAQALEALIQ